MNAGQKWLQLGFDILSHEFGHASDGQLLSEGADRIIERYPVLGRAVILASGAVVTLHLANVLSDRFDVMSKGFWLALRQARVSRYEVIA